MPAGSAANRGTSLTLLSLAILGAACRRRSRWQPVQRLARVICWGENFRNAHVVPLDVP